eukprot:IDg16615t1
MHISCNQHIASNATEYRALIAYQQCSMLKSNRRGDFYDNFIDAFIVDQLLQSVRKCTEFDGRLSCPLFSASCTSSAAVHAYSRFARALAACFFVVTARFSCLCVALARGAARVYTSRKSYSRRHCVLAAVLNITFLPLHARLIRNNCRFPSVGSAGTTGSEGLVDPLSGYGQRGPPERRGVG